MRECEPVYADEPVISDTPHWSNVGVLTYWNLSHCTWRESCKSRHIGAITVSLTPLP